MKKAFIYIFFLFAYSHIGAQISINDIRNILEKNKLIPDLIPSAQSLLIKNHIEEEEEEKKEVIQIPVYSEKDIIHADYSQNILFDLKCNIKLSQSIIFKSDKKIIIKGNGYKIYQAGSQLKAPRQNGKWNLIEFKNEITGKETFIDHEGTLIRFAKSMPHQATSWRYDEQSNIVKIVLPPMLKTLKIKHSDNVYINYELWFVRQKDRVISAENGILTFQCNSYYKPNTQFMKWTDKPYFYLENYKKDLNGIVIKDNIIYAPKKYKNITLCNLKSLFIIERNAKIECYDIHFTAATECIINNKGIAKFQNCHFEDTESEGIKSNKQLLVDKCHFHNITKNAITVSAHSNANITHCTFDNIGKYGSNNRCIISMGNSYIAYNTFKDYNYSAIRLGTVNAFTQEELNTSLVECNTFEWSKSWKMVMKSLGLSDSGAISVATNNKQCTIRYNTIKGFGGHGSNRGIFCDDGAFNVAIYGNMICDTENSFDIDSRECSTNNSRKVPDNCHYNTNNFICYNICTGSIKAEGNKSLKNNQCYFQGNILIGNDVKKHKNKIAYNMAKQASIYTDSLGIIDKKGIYQPQIDFSNIWIKNNLKP